MIGICAVGVRDGQHNDDAPLSAEQSIELAEGPAAVRRQTVEGARPAIDCMQDWTCGRLAVERIIPCEL